MKEKIKKIYLILGIPLLILAIVVLAIWIFKQVNWDFFTLNQKKCISEYLDSKYEYRTVESLSDEEIERISQIWNLDKTEPQKIKQAYIRQEEGY